ncbi:hypothetical protein D9M68_845390 [compost metagenome]
MALVRRVLLRGGQHQRREDAHAVDHAVEVDAEHPFPVLQRVFPEQSPGAHAGIVEQQVDLPERFHRGVSQRLHLLGARHVGAQADHRHVARLEFGHGRVQRVFLHVGQHQLHAEIGADAGEFLAKSGSTTGDDGYLVGKILHVVCPVA